MRITNKTALDALTREHRLSSSAARQIKKALAETKPKPSSFPCNAMVSNPDDRELKRKAAKTVGEVVQEFMSFHTPRFRADSALSRYKITIELLLPPLSML